jgi:hypothetical protein
MLRLVACLVLAWCACPAAACLNDNELPGHEREFRSQYRRQASPPPSTDAPVPPGYRVLLGGGGVLLVGAFGLTLVARRARG